MSIVETLGTTGMLICSIAYLVLFALLVARSRGHGIGRFLLAAVLIEIAWSGVAALGGRDGLFLRSSPTMILESVRVFTWVAFLLSLAYFNGDLQRHSGSWIWVGGTFALLLATVSVSARLSGAHLQWSLVPHLILTVLAIAIMEQIWRNMPPARRWGVKFLCIALLAKFVLELFVWSDALLFLAVESDWLMVRGYANAVLVPLIAVAAARNPLWKLDIAVSRAVILHTTTLLLSGMFLLSAAVGGFYLKYLGGSWGKIAAAMLGFLAMVSLGVIVLSGGVRARIRVYLAKNFFSYRYDYRQEWLKFTALLSEAGNDVDAASIAGRALGGFCSLVDSGGGGLWIVGSDGKFRCEAALNRQVACPEVSREDPLLKFVSEREYLVEIRELAAHPERYGGVNLPVWLAFEPSNWLLLPMVHEGALVAFAVLQHASAPMTIDWEVRDALKTSARQAASYLMLRRTVESLVEVRQFESYNHATAFLVHDLKNLVAQLSLLLRNADRHSENPEFRRDMVETVQNVLERMQEILLQLQAGKRTTQLPEQVLVVEVVRTVIGTHKLSSPGITLEVSEGIDDVRIMADRGRIERVFGHLLQNAVDATARKGDVNVSVSREAGQVVVTVQDSGVGMTESFVRSKLFRPFATTKTNGMGIGAFEARQYIQQIGGTIDVITAPGIGTTFTVRLPIRADHV